MQTFVISLQFVDRVRHLLVVISHDLDVGVEFEILILQIRDLRCKLNDALLHFLLGEVHVAKLTPHHLKVGCELLHCFAWLG